MAKCGKCGTPFDEHEGMLCDCYDDLCQGCGTTLQDSEHEICIACQIDAAELQGHR